MNRIERCAAMISVLQENPELADAGFNRLYDLLKPIVENDAGRRIRNSETRQDATQQVYIAVWRHIQNKPPPTTPVLLRMLIDGTLINAIRGDSRALSRDERASHYEDAYVHDTGLDEVMCDLGGQIL
jgi:DNA-directed RNA polymerase specialized sigma24 family protein